MVSGIYKITNPTGAVYIGQGVDVVKRVRSYLRGKIESKQPRIYNSIQKYGIDSHIIDIIQLCNPLELNRVERYWQEYYNVLGDYGLNCKYTETEDKSGVISQESRYKMSLAAQGRKRNEEAIEKMKQTNKRLLELGLRRTRKGQKTSKEVIQKIIATKEKNGTLHRKVVFTDIVKEKMSKDRKGKPQNHMKYYAKLRSKPFSASAPTGERYSFICLSDCSYKTNIDKNMIIKILGNKITEKNSYNTLRKALKGWSNFRYEEKDKKFYESLQKYRL